MKQQKESFVSVRLKKNTRDAFINKVKRETDHDMSSILRSLIELYISGDIRIDSKVVIVNKSQTSLFGD